MRFIILLFIWSFCLIFWLFVKRENPLLYFEYKNKIKQSEFALKDLSEKEKFLRASIKAIKAGDADLVDKLIKEKFNECKSAELRFELKNKGTE